MNGQVINVLQGLECRLQPVAQQRLGEGIDVVLQVAERLVQLSLQAPAFIHQRFEFPTIVL
ncbi:hypothetical protein QMK58_03435 [Pseudomonas sp. P8_241]|nr:hypothetical protein [Pseudomonas sp. P1.8]WPN47749.1 hypothetical protein QMK58_03435 [Pseudomonas sp. P8_241]